MRLSIKLYFIILFITFISLKGKIYAETTLIEGDLNSLVALSYTSCFDDRPILVFTEQLEGDATNILDRVGNVVYYNASWEDLVIDMCDKYEINKNKEEILLKDEGIYEIYLDVFSAKDMKMNSFIIQTDNKSPYKVITYRYDGRKYFRIKKIELEGKKHSVIFKYPNEEKIDGNPRIILVNMKERERVEELIWQKMNLPNTGFIYIFNKSAVFYLSKEADYIVKTIIRPPMLQLKKNEENVVKYTFSDFGEYENWIVRPYNVRYDYFIENEGLNLHVHFNGDETEDEYIQMQNESVMVDLIKYPYFNLTYKIENPEVQTIEVVAGIDFDKDGKVNEYVRGLYPRPALMSEGNFEYNLYKLVRSRFPYKEYYDLVCLELYPHKLWGIDCRSPERGRYYNFYIRNIEFYNYYEKPFIKIPKYALRETFYSKYEILKWPFNVQQERVRIEDNVLKIDNSTGYLELLRSVNSIDIKEYPLIKLEHKTEDDSYTGIRIYFDLDFDGDNVSDKTIFLNSLSSSKQWAKSEINAYDLIKTKFPDEIKYNLMQIRLRINNSVSFYLKELAVYSFSFFSDLDLIYVNPKVELDEEKLYSNFRRNIGGDELLFKKKVHLKKGYHHINFIDDDSFDVDWVILECKGLGERQGKKDEPEITFGKVNPTKYEVNIKKAKVPFWLVFNENFHRFWKVYFKRNKEGVEYGIDSAQGNRQKSGNKIKEYIISGNKIYKANLPLGDIKYLFKRPLVIDQYLINGYANGWYIDPKGLNVGEDFTLVIYYYPQLLFYLGLVISSLTFISLLVFCIRKLV